MDEFVTLEVLGVERATANGRGMFSSRAKDRGICEEADKIIIRTRPMQQKIWSDQD